MKTWRDPSLAVSLLELVFDRQSMSFACVDEDLVIRLVGPRLETFLEGAPPAVEDAYLSDVFIEFFGSEESLRTVLDGRSQVFRLSPVVRQTPTGEIRYLSFEFIRIPDSEWHGLLLVEDITVSSVLEQGLIQQRNELRLLRAELTHANAELQRLSQFKSALLSMAAHDLRSPLAALMLQIDLLLKDVERGQQTVSWAKTLQWMWAAAASLNTLISGLLDREQVEQGRLVLRLSHCDLVSVIRDVIRMSSPEPVGRVELQAPSTGLPLVADKERLQQMFSNLLDNALKYTPRNHHVLISVEQREDWAVVMVRDHGNGMTREQLNQLFKMYYRTEDAHESGVVGTGLGLFIVKALVEAHGGRVTVESELGQGTTFMIFLPLAGSLNESVNSA